MCQKSGMFFLPFMLLYGLILGEESRIIREDVIVHPEKHPIGLMENPHFMVAVDTNFNKIVIDNDLDVCYGIAAGDLDQDNDPDIVITQPYDSLILMYRYDPANTTFDKDTLYRFESHNNPGDTVNIFQVTVADMDSDGLNDVIFGQYDDGLYVLYNEGQAGFSDTVHISSSCSWMFDVADLNEDGLMDVVGNNNSWNTETWWIRQNADQSFSEILIDDDCGDAYGIDVADLDSDGDFDIVQGSVNGYDDLYWYENNGQDSFTKQMIDAYIDDPVDLICTDMDRDNDEDILVSACGSGELRLYENDGSGQFTIQTVTDSVDGMWHIGLQDMDSNQSVDMVTGNRNSDYFLWFSIDSVGFYSAHLIDGSIQYPQDFVFGDFNTDSMPDIAMISGHSAWGEYAGGRLTLYLSGEATDVSLPETDDKPLVPDLHHNFPNPFNPLTTIAFELPFDADVDLKIYDLMGREVMSLIQDKMHSGRHQVEFDASGLTSGLYLCRLKANGYTDVQKMILTK